MLVNAIGSAQLHSIAPPFESGQLEQTAWRLGPLSVFDSPVTFHASPQTQTLQIREWLGGAARSDYLQFQLTATAKVEVLTKGAIAVLANVDEQVLIQSEDCDESRLHITAEAGLYYLQFSSEAPIAAAFESCLCVQSL